MQTVLFHSTIFGPIHSRRLGVSLGINLMPNDGKVCSFDCLYCEAGFNAQGSGTTGLPTRSDVRRLLETQLSEMKSKAEPLDVITFSGNGEPTLHPEFERIVDDTLALRDRYYPEAKVSVLTNSTRLGSEGIDRALRRVDNNCLKLDSAIDRTVQRLDRPTAGERFSIGETIERIASFSPDCIVQTLLVRGEGIDNTTEEELTALAAAYRRIQPREVQLYSIDRKTPDETLRRVSAEELRQIAERLGRECGVKVVSF